MPFTRPVIPIYFSVNASIFGKNDPIDKPNIIVPTAIVVAEPENRRIKEIPAIEPRRSVISIFSGVSFLESSIDIPRPRVIEPQKNEVIKPAVLLLAFKISLVKEKIHPLKLTSVPTYNKAEIAVSTIEITVFFENFRSLESFFLILGLGVKRTNRAAMKKTIPLILYARIISFVLIIENVINNGEIKAPIPLSRCIPFIHGARLLDLTQTRSVLLPTTTIPAPIPLNTRKRKIYNNEFARGIIKKAIPVIVRANAATGLPFTLSYSIPAILEPRKNPNAAAIKSMLALLMDTFACSARNGNAGPSIDATRPKQKKAV